MENGNTNGVKIKTLTTYCQCEIDLSGKLSVFFPSGDFLYPPSSTNNAPKLKGRIYHFNKFEFL